MLDFYYIRFMLCAQKIKKQMNKSHFFSGDVSLLP